jgi:hypothetical protein
MTIDSGTIVESGDGSTAPSESLDDANITQVGESFSRTGPESPSPRQVASPKALGLIFLPFYKFFLICCV